MFLVHCNDRSQMTAREILYYWRSCNILVSLVEANFTFLIFRISCSQLQRHLSYNAVIASLKQNRRILEQHRASNFSEERMWLNANGSLT